MCFTHDKFYGSNISVTLGEVGGVIIINTDNQGNIIKYDNTCKLQFG